MPKGRDHKSSSDCLIPSEDIGAKRDGDAANTEWGARPRDGLAECGDGMAVDECDLMGMYRVWGNLMPCGEGTKSENESDLDAYASWLTIGGVERDPEGDREDRESILETLRSRGRCETGVNLTVVAIAAVSYMMADGDG